MIRSFATASLERYTIGAAIGAVLTAAVLSLVPAISFGSFWEMAATLIIADIILYIGMKIGLIRFPRALRKS